MIELAQIEQPAKNPGGLVPFRFRQLGDDVLLTSYFGDWVFVKPDEFRAMYTGSIPS